jgi:hypothetical protein
VLDTGSKGHEGGDAEAESDQHTGQALRRELWLDLEGTLIPPFVSGWRLSDISNLDKIKQVITSSSASGWFDQMH